MTVGRATGLELRVGSDGDGDVPVVSVFGEVDLYTAPDLLETLRDLADADGRHVIVDLTGTTFIDSTGLGVLIAATKMLRLKRGDLHLAGSHGSTERAIYAAGLHTFFRLAPNVEEAREQV